MHGVLRSACPAAALATLVALAGCGKHGSAPTTTPAQATAADVVAVTIESPANGDLIHLRGRRSDGAGRGMLRVSGYAAAGSTVQLKVNCTPIACLQEAKTSAGERWTAQIPITVRRSQANLSVIAGPADPRSASASNSLTVRLIIATPRPALAKHRRNHPPQTQSPHGTTESEPLSGSPTPTIGVGGPSPSTSGSRSTAPVYLIGDSLAQGIQPLMSRELAGRPLHIDAMRSRPMAAGMRIAQGVPKGSILAISLFTNDDPRSVAALDAAVRQSAAIVGPSGCVVWATIVRPPYAGVSYAAANARLQQLADTRGLGAPMRIVPWAAAVASDPSLVGGDGVHGTPAGYATRAALYAQAIKSC